MLSISKIINSKESRPRWRFTKYYTGEEKTPEEKSRHIEMEEKDEKECQNRPIDIQSISSYVKKWVQDHVGFDFKFRQYQFEYTVQTLYNILNDGIKINCLEAPTGSGKSWIAFIVSGVAWEYYRKTSYILVSDLGLMEQYMNDVSKYKFNDIGRMKGLGNYRCSLNNMAFPSGDCKLHKMSYNVLMNPKAAQNKGYYCTEECECICDRKKAIVSPITIMTYVLYLCHMNDVLPIYESSEELPPFDKRDILICDEVHKMPDIVQNWCSPEFTQDYDMGEFTNYIDYCLANNFLDDEERQLCTINNLIQAQQGIVNSIGDKRLSFEYYKKYYEIQKVLVDKLDMIRDNLSDKEMGGSKLSKEDKMVQFACSWLENRHTHFSTYPKIVDRIGIENIVVNSVFDYKTQKFDNKNFKINCVYEEWLVNEFFNNKSNNMLMMTATVGDFMLFRREIGVDIWEFENQKKDFVFMRIPSTFDFSRSPIYVLPTYKMSYTFKDQNMPYVVDLIDKILAHHSNEKGIIHTGSYEFSKKLREMAKKPTQHRLLCYSNAREKDVYLDEYGFSKNRVLAGPSIIEGLDMPDDECRFMIVMKVPYPSLGDQLVKAKKDIIPNWYNGETIKSMIQSFGRGIRHKDDWCVTYIIDGSFCSIFNQTKDTLQPELLGRIQYVQP